MLGSYLGVGSCVGEDLIGCKDILKADSYKRPSHRPFKLVFSQLPWWRIIRPSPEESKLAGLGWSGAWECLFLVNASDGLYHKRSLGNPTESNHRGYCLHRGHLRCAAKLYHHALLKMLSPVILREPNLSSIWYLGSLPSGIIKKISGNNCEETQNYPHFNFNSR